MRLAAAVLLLLLTACATTSSTTKAAANGPSPVIAKFGDRVVRQSEVDARASDELVKLQEQIYELRVETAERIALEAIVQQKAKAAGMSEDDWLAQRLDKGLKEPSDDEMRALFEKARARLPAGVTYEDVKPQLAQAVQREARTKRARELFGELKKEAGFVVMLEAPPRVRKTVDATGPGRGPADAKIVIVEFADFECPYCARASATVERVLAAYPGKIRLVFRHFPLSFHPKAPKAAEAAACAEEQGKFWELHDALFESQELDVDAMKAQAARLGVDAKKFDACVDSGRMAAVVKRDQAAGQQAGVSGTPAFFINGLMLSGAQPEEAFRKLIDEELDRLGVK